MLGRNLSEQFFFIFQDNDFLELRRLDMIFGLFTAAACILVLMFFVAALATIRRNKFLLKAYCAVIALMVVVQLVAGLLAFTYSDQINQLASDDILYESLTKTAANCCGVLSSKDWGFSETQLTSYSCFRPNFDKGCEKQIRSRISADTQFLGAASMGVVLIEVSIPAPFGSPTYFLPITGDRQFSGRLPRLQPRLSRDKLMPRRL
ncbi:unnamed protein product [Heligmosomoides polygyrus]|uniref:Tetraspanin family protein n=1 Tax=Heligmosomoides polygyrus TaxID=6339 RepID=A0A183G338_HELPZ|nr:unnamed protein product [Heligmosomoides polygyrus]